jgi:hypothetical protein
MLHNPEHTAQQHHTSSTEEARRENIRKMVREGKVREQGYVV